jgi:dienelactone hydrolase
MNKSLLDNQGDCCPKDAIPFKQEDPNYVPKGLMINYDGVSAYCVGSGSKCVMFLHDIFGLNSGMNKQHCDTLSEALSDYIIIAPDFFPDGNVVSDAALKERGNTLMRKLLWPICCGCTLFSFITNHGWKEGSEAIFNKTTSYMMKDRGVTSFVLMGICWGSYIAYKACYLATHADRIVCNLSVHPSVATLSPRFNEKEMDHVNAVNCPQFVACTKQEPASWKPNGIVEQTLAKKPFGTKNEFLLYNEDHGFFTRGDTKNEKTRLAIQDCLNKMVAFIKKQ